MNTKYPTVTKVVSTPDDVMISMENVIPDDPNYPNHQKTPLVVSIVPHNGRFWLHCSGMGSMVMKIDQTLGNGTYIELVER